jgi:hypothetical protein
MQLIYKLASFLKADDPEHYTEVIYAANSGGFHEDLVRFLEMCIKKVKVAYPIS